LASNSLIVNSLFGSRPCSIMLARELSTSFCGPVASENGCRINGGSFHVRFKGA
jgi:phosphatidylglycerophosphate synthase